MVYTKRANQRSNTIPQMQCNGMGCAHPRRCGMQCNGMGCIILPPTPGRRSLFPTPTWGWGRSLFPTPTWGWGRVGMSINFANRSSIHYCSDKPSTLPK